jgi:2-polyprenyl-3-methyl-5-hydroxy-6-metoxy-1,4-benzoquinol methylase
MLIMLDLISEGDSRFMKTINSSDIVGADINRNIHVYSWRSRWRHRNNYASQTKIKRFRWLVARSQLIISEKGAVFDQGFGMGLMMFCFPPQWHIAGLELDAENVERTRQEAELRGFTNIDLRQYMPGSVYPDEWDSSFDIVISSHVLEHMQDPEAGLNALCRLLKPNGQACLVVPINEKPGDDLNHFSNFSEASFLELLRHSNLEPTSTVACDRLWHLVAPIGYHQQRKPGPFIKMASMAVNLATAFLPVSCLRLIDVILGKTGCPNRQLFVLCRPREQ